MMEYSIARNLSSSNTDFYNVPFPNLRSEPADDQVNPGIGQIISLYETIVPMQAHSQYMIEKKIEPELVAKLEEPAQDLIPTQIGAGQSQIDPNILASFQHPIVTDSIIFEKDKKSAKKHKMDIPSEAKGSKLRKVEHKFYVV